MFKDYAKQINTLAEEEKDHQEDLEKLQEKLLTLKSSAGIYRKSDSKLTKNIEAAIKTRESSVETCKEKIGEVKSDIESKLEKLNLSINKTEERVTQMGEMVNSLKHKNEKVIINIRNEIQQGKEEAEDAKEKGNSLKKIIEIAALLIPAVDIAANRITEFISYMHTTGLLR